MHDLVIRNGTIVDGTGAERFHGDVAIDDGRISIVGSVSEKGRREIDAAGQIVPTNLDAPGSPLLRRQHEHRAARHQPRQNGKQKRERRQQG